MLRGTTKALLRLCLIPVGAAIGVGWGAYQNHEPWGEPLMGAGVFGAILLLPFIWKQW